MFTIDIHTKAQICREIPVQAQSVNEDDIDYLFDQNEDLPEIENSSSINEEENETPTRKKEAEEE